MSSQHSILERALAGAGLLFGLAGAALVARFDPSVSRFFPVCPMHALTGISCPGCGLTRGFHSLFHGDIWMALQFNLMLPVYFVAMIFIAISLTSIVIRGRNIKFQLFSSQNAYYFFVAAGIFFILRNLPFYPFSLFSH
ncbi:MAG: DUF2752 domain-containing protein [Pyrinomonadaceae bacterium]|nr:DUF2752 domain-containing protein [Pyrinomonadaceae bacterium]